jgi:CPA2 family monovalent cation:H+ antiporter-2
VILADLSGAFLELGAAVAGLALLSRLADRLGFPAVPLYLLFGLAFGNGGLVPLRFSEPVIRVVSEIGVTLLLFMLGLEYTGDELAANLRTGLRAGLVDLALNFTPGLAAGFLLGWGPLAAVLLGGVTWISSTGIIARLLSELNRTDAPETPPVLSVLVLEDLALAVYLPLVTALLLGHGPVAGLVSVLVALAGVAVILFVALRYGAAVSRLVTHRSDEVILLTLFGAMLLVAGVAERLHLSAAVGAFLLGVALSGPVVHRARRLIEPLRDLFSAIFFLFFGLQIDPATLPPVLLPALVLGVLTTLTKYATGWWAARRVRLDAGACRQAGILLVSHGEFSIVIAGLGLSAGLDPSLGPLSAAYVLFLAVLGPVLARVFLPPGPPPGTAGPAGVPVE